MEMGKFKLLQLVRNKPDIKSLGHYLHAGYPSEKVLLHLALPGRVFEYMPGASVCSVCVYVV